MFEVGFIPAPGFGLTAGLRSSAKRWKVGNFSQRGVRVRRAAYGEEFNEFETKGNTKLQDKLVQEINFDIHKIVLADHIDFYVVRDPALSLQKNFAQPPNQLLEERPATNALPGPNSAGSSSEQLFPFGTETELRDLEAEGKFEGAI